MDTGRYSDDKIEAVIPFGMGVRKTFLQHFRKQLVSNLLKKMKRTYQINQNPTNILCYSLDIATIMVHNVLVDTTLKM